MAKCPKCETEVQECERQIKFVGRPDRQGNKLQLEIGVFLCPRCQRSFRKVLNQLKVDETGSPMEVHVARMDVGVYRCPVDGITCPTHELPWNDLIDPELIDGVRLGQCHMCGFPHLAGAEGIFHDKCNECTEEGYVVQYKGKYVCGSCLYRLLQEDGLLWHKF